jgi:hypothetical protein
MFNKKNLTQNSPKKSIIYTFYYLIYSFKCYHKFALVRAGGHPVNTDGYLE